MILIDGTEKELLEGPSKFWTAFIAFFNVAIFAGLAFAIFGAES